MIISTEDALRAHIKQNTPAKLYFLYGDEDYLKSNYASLIESKCLADDAAGFNSYRFNSDMAFGDFYEACSSLPLMGERICVFVKDFAFNKLSDTELNDYIGVFENIPDSTTVIFCMATVQVDKNNAKWKNIINIFDKYGICAFLTKRNVNSMVKMLVSAAQKRSASISDKNAQYLINAVGDDLNRLLGEFDKVCAYADGREITPEIIDAVAVRSVEASVYDITKAINSADGDRAYFLLNQLLRQKTEPVFIIGVLAGEYIDLYRMKTAKKYSGTLAEISSAYQYKNREFRLKNAARLCPNYSEKRIKKAVAEIADADIRIKSTGVGAQLILEELIAKLLLLMGKKR